MYLNELFTDAPKILIEQLSCDSRLPMKNCIYFCMSGVKNDGHDYIKEAIENGASAIVYTKDIDTSYNSIFIKVKNINLTLANVAKKMYNFDSNDLDIFVTCGCYGKSSVSSYINQLINDKDITSSIGAYGINYKDKQLTYPSATLTLLDNYRYLSDIKNSGCKKCTLETDSLSLSYNRLEGINPKAFVYTSTSQYSKDYKGFSHKYFDSLRKYLYTLEETTTIVLNKDDVSYKELIQACSNNVVTYGFDKTSNYVISNPKYYINKTTFDIRYNNVTYCINSPLISKYNIYNLTAAIATVVESKIKKIEEAIEIINNITSPDGILHLINLKNKNVIVDYCYALDCYNSLNEFIRELSNINKIYIIMSVNYNDTSDSISSYYSYIKDLSFLTIFTENNIYDDDIHDLLNEAAKAANGYNFLTIEDRAEAIKVGIDLLDENDVLIILGKGNGRFFYKNFNKVVYEGDENVVLNYLKTL